MNELPPCKLCEAQSVISTATLMVYCPNRGCRLRDFRLTQEDWLKLMSDTVPDWARVRETAKEVPLKEDAVIAWSMAEQLWCSESPQRVASYPKDHTQWFHAPQIPPKELSAFEKWWATVAPVAECETSMTREQVAKSAWDAGAKDAEND